MEEKEIKFNENDFTIDIPIYEKIGNKRIDKNGNITVTRQLKYQIEGGYWKGGIPYIVLDLKDVHISYAIYDGHLLIGGYLTGFFKKLQATKEGDFILYGRSKTKYKRMTTDEIETAMKNAKKLGEISDYRDVEF
jgi:hypothetical protein